MLIPIFYFLTPILHVDEEDNLAVLDADNAVTNGELDRILHSLYNYFTGRHDGKEIGVAGQNVKFANLVGGRYPFGRTVVI